MITSPTLMPMRNSILRWSGSSVFLTPSSCWTSTAHGIYRTGKLSQQIIPRGVDYSTSVLLDKRRHHLPVGGQGANGRLLILAHEAAVAFDIGTKDGSELALHTHFRGGLS